MSSSDLAAFIAQYAAPYNPETDSYRRPPYAAPVKAGKATAIYNAHSYHTKVPPQGIEPYIQHYTNAGDLVLDPFCGSGMTGVAALKLGRRVILNDLSPAAAHIAYNYCTPVDVDALKREFARIKAAVKDEFDWLYGTTCDRCGGDATIRYMLWCDVLECDRCGYDLPLWELTMNKEKGEVNDSFDCPQCKKHHDGKNLNWLKSVPVLTSYECNRCKPNRSDHPTTLGEKEKIAEIDASIIPYWFPTVPFDQSFEMWRGVHKTRLITDSSKFYTHRNLWGLSLLWNQIVQISDETIRSKLQFVFTSMSVKLASRMSNVSFRGPNKINLAGQLPGTLYIPSLAAERNVWLLFEDKASDMMNYAKEVSSKFRRADVAISIGSADKIDSIISDSIDYIFTDPPFGSNLFYADLNFLWEVWLGNLTDQSHEAVVHLKHKAKNILPDYARLMTESFCEMNRALKPGRWASIVFHNSDDKIWQVILDATQASGFELAEINSFNKEQLTFKGRKGAKGLERVTNQDIVLNLRKPAARSQNNANAPSAAKNGDAEARIVQQVAEFLATNPNPNERTLQHFWNVVLRDMLQQGVVDVSMEQVGALLPYYFKQADGKWYLRGEAVLGGDVFNLKTDAGALAWLTAVLNEPHTLGDLIPKFQIAAAQSEMDAGRLEKLLEQNFWQDKKTGRWRLPTDDERAKLMHVQDIADQAHLRVIDKYLAGASDHRPSQWQLVEWLRFAYKREAFPQVVGLAKQIDETQVDASFRKEYKKIVAVSRMRGGDRQ
ncbi:hypothetical protein FBQ82_02220 [Anaerolineae bacterium CFX7]|nr:hypothetical protein [Anaerolineae bacterium CFX7]